jgi:hypothetical protein
MSKRLIDYDLEIERVAEWLEMNRRDKIIDKDTFNLYYNSDIAEDREDNLDAKALRFREKVFQEYLGRNPNVEEKGIFKEAKGKDLERDIRQTADVVVRDRKEYIRRGASEVDLKGYDTERKALVKRIDRRKVLTLRGVVKGKTVKVEKTFVIIRKKKILRLRDKKGRFASSI